MLMALVSDCYYEGLLLVVLRVVLFSIKAVILLSGLFVFTKKHEEPLRR